MHIFFFLNCPHDQCHFLVAKKYNITMNILYLPYFFRYQTELSSFRNNLKNLDPSYKMDLARSLELFRKGNTCVKAKFHRTDLVICSHSREGKTPSYSKINTVFGYITGFASLKNKSVT